MILVGPFNEEDLKNGKDKIAVEKTKKETGFQTSRVCTFVL